MVSGLPFASGSKCREFAIDSVFARRPASESWKHSATLFDEIDSLQGSLVLFLVRHPISWLLALHRKPYHLGPVSEDFGTFVATRHRTLGREGLGRVSLSPIELWDAKVASYQALISRLRLSGIAWRVIKFEDLVVDPAGQWNTISPVLPQVSSNFRTIPTSVKQDGRTADDIADYYSQERWKRDLRHSIGETIFARLTNATFWYSGY